MSSIIELITQGTDDFCINSLSPHYAHLWCEILNIVGLVLAVPHVIRFERRMRKYMDPKNKPTAKLWTFKAFVFLQFVQLIIFGLLNDKVFNPTEHITYNDLYYGLPAAITCFESWIFTGLFMWSFPTRLYRPDYVGTQGYRMPYWRAIFNCINLGDIFGGIALMFKLVVEGQWLPTKSAKETSHRMTSVPPSYNPRKPPGYESDTSQSHLARPSV